MTKKTKTTKWSKEWKNIYYEFMETYYVGKSCYICNEIGTVHYHHIDQSDKEHEIVHMWSYKPEKVKTEIDKCVILCEKCHRLTHKLLKDIKHIETKPIVS